MFSQVPVTAHGTTSFRASSYILHCFASLRRAGILSDLAVVHSVQFSSKPALCDGRAAWGSTVAEVRHEVRGEEVGELGRVSLGRHVLSRSLELVCVKALLDLFGLFVEDLVDVLCSDGRALVRLCRVFDPVPDLHSGNLGSRRVLHHVVDGYAAEAADPVGDVDEHCREVRPDATLCDLSRNVGVEQVQSRNLDLLPADVVLVRSGHVLIEDLEGDLDEGRVGYPSSVVACLDLAQFVRTDLLHRRLVGLVVALDGNLRCHTTNGSNLASVAGLDEKLDVRRHEWHRHRHVRAVGEDKGRVVSHLLDEGKDVVPATAVEAGGVLSELVQDLVHHKRARDSLDEDGRTNGATLDAELVLGGVEDVVPQACLEVVLHLWEVKYGPRPRLTCSFALWKKKRPKSNIDPDIGCPSTVMWASSRCQPRARTIRVAMSSLSLYSLPDFASLKAICLRMASYRLTWPSRLLAQVGAFESSKSAM